MGRPKSSDPKVPVAIRLPQSVVDAWTEAAERKGRTLKEHLEFKLIEAAQERYGVHPPA